MAKRISLATASKPRIPQALTLTQLQDWESSGEWQMVSVDLIDPSTYQARLVYHEQALEELTASIKDLGVIQPVVLRPKNPQRFELVAGHRRWLAAIRAGKCSIPAIVRSLDNREAAVISLIENLQREDLNPLEIAQGLQRMIDEFTVTQKDLATLLGRSKSDIALTLGLLKLLPEVQAYVRQGMLTAGHGRLLYRLSPEKQKTLAKMAMTKNWTVRKLEQIIADQKQIPRSESPQDLHASRLQTVLMEHFSAPVRIRSNQKGAGLISIRYNSLAECEAILGRFGLIPEQYR